MKGFRSPMLGAMLALACLPAMDLARRDEDVHHLFLRSVGTFAPDLDAAEAVKLLLADAAALQLVGGSYEDCARRIVDDFEAWANGERRPILVRDEPVAGEWLARIAFAGPGRYRAEAYRQAAQAGERGEVIVREAATRADAWRVAVDEAKARALDGEVARLSAAMGCDVRPEVDALLEGPDLGRRLRSLVDDMNRAAGKLPSVLVGETEAGPHDKIEALTAEGFAARYIPAGDLHVDKPLPSTPHPRHQWMTSEADRGMVMQTTGGPVDFRRAGEESRARRVVIDRPGPASPAPLRYSAEPRLHPAGRCTCEGAGAGTCDWCEMNRRRELREGRPVMRDQQRKAGKARSKKKARRGW